MTTAYNIAQAVARAREADRTSIKDPGSNGVILVSETDLGVVVLETASSTYTLQAAAQVPLGHRILCIGAAASMTVNGVAVADGGYAEFVVSQDSAGANEWSLTSEGTTSRTAPIPIGNDWRTWDALITNLPATSANDDLGLVTGTFLTGAPSLNHTETNPSASARRARVSWVVPQDYKAGSTVTIRAAVTETVAATTATLTANVVRQAAPSVEIGPSASDIVGGGTISLALTSTNIVAGDVLDIRLTTTLTHVAASPNYGITAVDVLYTSV